MEISILMQVLKIDRKNEGFHCKRRSDTLKEGVKATSH